MNLDKTDSMGPGKLVRHMQNLSYTYDEYLICIGLGPSISSVICKDPSYSGPSYPSSAVTEKSSSMFDEFRVKHEKCFQKGEGWEFFRPAFYSQLCLMEGLIFYNFTISRRKVAVLQN